MRKMDTAQYNTQNCNTQIQSSTTPVHRPINPEFAMVQDHKIRAPEHNKQSYKYSFSEERIN